MTLSARERSIFAGVADTLLAPAPPLPPIRETDAVAAFERWLTRAPRINRMALRGLLLVLGLRWRRLSPARRFAAFERLARHSAGKSIVDALRAAAAVSYYGDAQVSALLGYAPSGRGGVEAAGLGPEDGAR
jgi:hypothetical protein